MPEEKKVDLKDYVEVSQRIVEFRNAFPDGRLRPIDPARPYTIETVGEKTYIVVVAAAYRTPDDPNPGIGMAWEQYPGKTSFTRDSELQNAETSAWGRAMVAALAVDTKRGIATAEEVRARTTVAAAKLPPADFARAELLRLLNKRGIDVGVVAEEFAKRTDGDNLRTSDKTAEIEKLLAEYREGAA